MKIRDAIGQVDKGLTNIYAQAEKIKWLSQVDMRIKTQILDNYEEANAAEFCGYTFETDLDTVLLVPAPFDEMYLRYLEAQIYYRNQEEDRCNNASDAFDVLHAEFQRYYNRTHMPKGQKLTV